MVIIESSIFTNQISDLLDDEDYSVFQEYLCKHPNSGDIIPGTGGLRKIRCALPGRGKKGSARIIYYWFDNKNQIYMLFAYPKNKQVDLTPQQKNILMQYIKEELKGEK